MREKKGGVEMKLKDKYGNDITKIAQAEMIAKRTGDKAGQRIFRNALKVVLK